VLDVVIRNGLVVDGTGRAAYRADVGIAGDRVVAIGEVGEAVTSIDATGKVVAPGFIDVHTHYDAQVTWDAAMTPSPLHGVTTVIAGNCGFTLAPVDGSTRDYVMQMLACVEGMPVESLATALPWDWNTVGDWLDRLEGRVGMNVGFSAGHSTIRRLVMGDDWQREATDVEIARMEREVDIALEAGALGFSSSWGEAHADHLGNPVPSRFAVEAELVRLAARLAGRDGTMLEFIPSVQPRFPQRSIDVMVDMAVAAERPLNWNVISVGTGANRQDIDARLAASDRGAERGARIVALTMPVPVRLRLNLLTTIVYHSVPSWGDVLTLPLPDRLRALADRATRDRLRAAAEAQPGRIFLDFGPMRVESVTSAALAPLMGRTIAEIAGERGCSAVDAFLDVALADELRTCFATKLTGDDEASWAARRDLWDDPRTLIGASDAGAHLDMLATFGYFTDLVGPIVRERRLLTLEEAVRHVTDAPARVYGLVDRGRLAEGAYADVVVFDPAVVRTGEVVLQPDMPGGESRLFAPGIGIEHVLVNGQPILEAGKLTGATAGTVLRAGRDTR
jgi:N-acyl-D-aspartate/D-glutamate deacylase